MEWSKQNPDMTLVHQTAGQEGVGVAGCGLDTPPLPTYRLEGKPSFTEWALSRLPQQAECWL